MKNIFIIALVTLFATVSCTKDWEEMNVNPNVPADVPMTNLLANSLVYTGDSFFDSWQGLNNFVSYSGHISKIQYIDEARYQYRTGTVDAAFRDYYRVQLDLSKLYIKAVEAGDKPYTEAVATTFSVFLWQMAVDQWGDIPYTQALQAEVEDELLTPTYDKAEDIYAALIVKLEEANTKFNTPPNTANPEDIGSGDFIYGGDVLKWQKFCNSLRLRIAIRTQNADLFQKVAGDVNANPVFTSMDDEAKLKWQGTSPWKEPWALDLEERDDHGMAKTFVDMLLSLDDPRLAVYALPNGDGNYVGVAEGAADDSFVLSEISRIGTKYRDDVAGYTYFLRYAEVEFIKAEGALLGWGGDAQASYESGIAAVFEETGVTESLDTYMALPEIDFANESVYSKMEKVWLQKWIGLFKQGQELWAENRRTDFPMINVAESSVYPGHNRQPFRYPYPDTEFNLNADNVSGPASVTVDHFWGEQLFWDKRTGVN